MHRSCTQCLATFEVTDDDLAFYDKVSPVFNGKKELIPPPTLCPDCRFRRRMVWRREHALKSRACDACGASIISVHTADVPYPVYCLKCWWGDGWDPLAYGRAFDPAQPFLDQFFSLQQNVPQPAMMNDNGVGSENCEYTQDFAFGKNCYLITGSWELEDCSYCDCNCLKSRHLFDCYAVHFSELVYESLTSQRLYRCAHLLHCEQCTDCLFGVDLKGCSDCIGCIGLRQKRYHIFNQEYPKEEYERRKEALALSSRSGLCRFQSEFEQWILRFPRRAVHLINCENCNGDDLFHCKDTIGFQFDGAEYCKFIVHGDAPKNCYDVSQTGRPEWCYEGCTPDNSYMTHFTTWCWKDKNVMYSDNCHSCEHLFGCIGLKRKRYCILNKQYTKEEYENLVPKIINSMRSDGAGAAMNPSPQASGLWGEFFPMSMSPFCYNETAAQEYFPSTKEQVQALGLQWRDDDPRLYKEQNVTLPDRIEDVPDTITDALLACEQCRKNFKIQKHELAFYRSMHLPVPGLCYDCRYRARVARRNPRRLWQRNCMKCGKGIETTYAPERPEIVYCESCYLAEVY